MTLKEKFKTAMNYQFFFGSKEDDKIERSANNVELIVNKFAIEFADWFHENCYEDHVGYYKAEDLLDFYKKQKGL
jgi:hypothetical protein